MNMQDLRAKSLDIWSQLAFWQRFAGIATILSAIGLFVVMGLWMREPKYAVLYRDLNERDAAAIVNELESLRIPYRLQEGGTAIEVEEKQVAQMRLRLAAENLPQGGTIGYEMFDSGSFGNLGMTEFMQRVNYQRALEGELSRTITAVEGVDLARVHLVLPEESLFVEQQQPPKASVILKIKPGAKLSATQLQSVRFLVSNSVEGLDPKNITLVDVAGNLYDMPDAKGEMSLATATSSQLEIQRLMELETQNDLQAMLDQTLGPNKTVVRVNIDMNWDQEESQVELYAPAGEVGSVIRSSSREEENWSGAGANAAAGIPGVDPNAPIDDATYQTGEGTGGEYNRRSDTINYEVSKEIRSKVKQPGTVDRLTVAVLMDESLPVEQAESIQTLVEAAVGIDAERGDLVQVQRIPFNSSFYADEMARFEDMQQQEFYIRIGIIVAILVGLGLILFFMRKFFTDMQQRMLPYVVEPEMPALPKEATTATASLQNSANAAYARAAAHQNKYEYRLDNFEDFFQLPPPDESELRLRAIARHNPEIIASILEDWADLNGSSRMRNDLSTSV
jgi:flagellar M-ring protein FliF